MSKLDPAKLFTELTQLVISLQLDRLTNRDFFVVTDYVLSTSKKWFFTYNNDIEHPYFAPRDGFVRVHVRNQGAVGQPSRADDVVRGVKSTRVSWIVNADMGGA